MRDDPGQEFLVGGGFALRKMRFRSWLLVSYLTTCTPLLVTGCGSDGERSEGEGSFEIDDGAGKGAYVSAVATPDKETVLELKTGAKISVPAGAVAVDVELGLQRAPDEKARELVQTIPNTDKVASAPYVLTPHGTKFLKDVEVTLPINKASNPEKLVVIWLEDENDKEWDFLGKAKVTSAKTATVTVNHFSVLLLVEREADVPSVGDGDSDEDPGVGAERDAGTGTDVEPNPLDAGGEMNPGNRDGGGGSTGGGRDSGSPGDADGGLTPPAPVPVSDALYVIHNGSGNTGAIDRRNMADLSLAESVTFTSGANRGATFVRGECSDGYFVQVGDDAGIRVFTDIYRRTEQGGGGFDPQRDREIGTASIESARDVVSMNRGLLAVADYGAGNIKVFAETAGPEALPLFTLGAGSGTSVWGLAYDGVYDRLYAARTNGSVAVYDDVADSAYVNRSAPDRTFTSSTPHAAHTSYRGILYDFDKHALVVSDVGALDESESADYASDGSLIVFEGPESLSGSVTPSQVIAGSATHLGNPVDLHLANYNGTGEGSYPPGRSLTIFVADNGSNEILQFVGFFDLEGGNVAPTAAVSADGPEAFAGPKYVGDGWDCGAPNFSNVAIAQNPGVAQGEILPGNYRVSFALVDGTDNAAGTFDTYEGADPLEEAMADRFVNGLAADEFGNGLFTYSGSTGAGIAFVHQMGARKASELDTSRRDRTIEGEATSLVDPRGLAVGNEVVFVADPSAGDIKVFSLFASGDVAPLFVIDELDGVDAVGDVAYVRWGGTLYAAASDGRVLAYDNVLTTQGVGGPTRTLSFGATHASGLFMHYSSLLVADMGQPGVADGAIYYFDDVETADGLVDPTIVITGGETLLEDPVSVVLSYDSYYDGDQYLYGSLWVGDASANQISIWAGFTEDTGELNIVPTTIYNRPRPVAMSLVP